MTELEQAQKIAGESGFELVYSERTGLWQAIHELIDKGTDTVFDIWTSYVGENPLLVAQAAKDARWFDHRGGRVKIVSAGS